MRTASVLVTGANGEIGHGLITRLAGTGRPIVTIDIAPLEPSLGKLVRREVTGSTTDTGLLERVPPSLIGAQVAYCMDIPCPRVSVWFGLSP